MSAPLNVASLDTYEGIDSNDEVGVWANNIALPQVARGGKVSFTFSLHSRLFPPQLQDGGNTLLSTI